MERQPLRAKPLDGVSNARSTLDCMYDAALKGLRRNKSLASGKTWKVRWKFLCSNLSTKTCPVFRLEMGGDLRDMSTEPRSFTEGRNWTTPQGVRQEVWGRGKRGLLRHYPALGGISVDIHGTKWRKILRFAQSKYGPREATLNKCRMDFESIYARQTHQVDERNDAALFAAYTTVLCGLYTCSSTFIEMRKDLPVRLHGPGDQLKPTRT